MTLGSKSSIAGRRFPVFFLFLVGAFASENPIFKNSSECQRHCSYYTESRVTGQAFKTANCEKKPKEDTFECVCYTDFQYSLFIIIIIFLLIMIHYLFITTTSSTK